MSRTLAIANQKGGVGKTTTAINLSASLAATKKRVLLIDLDSQGNATMGSGIDKNALQLSAYDMLTGGQPLAAVVQHSEAGGYDLVPGNSDLTAAEVELLELEEREFRLRNSLREVDEQYDYIIVDCPPSLSMLTINALAAADGVIIPMQCEYFALEGLAGLLDTISRVQESVNAGLRVEGVLRTMYDARTSLARDVSEQLHAYFQGKLYRSVIPRNVRLAEAPSHGLPVFAYDSSSKGAVAYLALAGEVLRRHEQEARLVAQSEADSGTGSQAESEVSPEVSDSEPAQGMASEPEQL